MHAGSAADREAFLLPGAETPLLTAMEGGERLAVCLAFGEFRGGGIKVSARLQISRPLEMKIVHHCFL